MPRHQPRHRSRRLWMLAAAAVAATACGRPSAPVAPAAAPELPLLAEPGPWPWASHLIVYGGRLWLANTVKERSHNSADLWSYDPTTGRARFERRLFSQGVGRPAVWHGLLFWPHDDSRFHLGTGQVSVTDGRRWALRTIGRGPIDHVTALAVQGGALRAAASGPRPLLYASSDAGRSWRLEWRAPSGRVRRIARITRLAVLDGVLYGDWVDGLQVAVERRLVRLGARGEARLPGWPRGEILALQRFRGGLTAILETAHGRVLWRTDGHGSARVGAGPPCRWPRDLAADGGSLLALCVEDAGGTVWSSDDPDRPESWSLAFRTAAGEPQELAVFGGQPYLAGRGPSGRGALWGPPAPAPGGGAPSRTLDDPPVQVDARALEGADARLAAALVDPAADGGRAAGLVDEILGEVAAGAPAALFARHLEGPFASGRAVWLEGRAPLPRADLGRWALLYGMTVAGGGEVPVDWLRRPWTAPPNDREKYLDPLPAALEALSAAGRASPAALDALVARLDPAGGDPDWVTGDVVGALTAVTGQPFAYDAAAWRAWWARERGRADPTPAPAR